MKLQEITITLSESDGQDLTDAEMDGVFDATEDIDWPGIIKSKLLPDVIDRIDVTVD